MNLPEVFVHNVHNTFGDRGRLFIRALPGLIDEAAERWQLTDVRPLPDLSFNFVAFARRAGVEVTLKLGVPDGELTSGIHALRHFAGRGSVRLLESDSPRGMLLLERLEPGELLASMQDDAAATRIAAQVMLALWRPVPADAGLIRLADWYAGLDRFRQHNGGSTAPFDPALFERAQAEAADLLRENHLPRLIHGDLHHFNILSSARGWLVIDPKGVIGPAAFEVGPFLFNPWAVTGLAANAAQLMASRIASLSDALQLDRERIRSWGIAYGVLSAVWSLEGSADWHTAMDCAAILAGLKL